MSLWLLNTLTKEKGKDKMKHALVVGGTGMLKDVTLWLVKLEYHVSVIGRTKNKFSRIQNEVADPKQLTFLQLDYTNTNILKEKLTSAIAKNGPIELVVAWIHSTAPNALQTITEIVSTTNPNQWELYQILGSSSKIINPNNKERIAGHFLKRYVQLGFIIENGHSRWLTHEEISAGVIQAICTKKPVTQVGLLEPWEMRP
jgi:hypothetical protein